MQDNEHLARAELRYLHDEKYRAQVEEVVDVMMVSIGRVHTGTKFMQSLLQQERILVRMTAMVTLLMIEEKDA